MLLVNQPMWNGWGGAFCLPHGTDFIPHLFCGLVKVTFLPLPRSLPGIWVAELFFNLRCCCCCLSPNHGPYVTARLPRTSGRATYESPGLAQPCRHAGIALRCVPRTSPLRPPAQQKSHPLSLAVVMFYPVLTPPPIRYK